MHELSFIFDQKYMFFGNFEKAFVEQMVRYSDISMDIYYFLLQRKAPYVVIRRYSNCMIVSARESA